MNRIKWQETAVYHCMTRAVAGERLLEVAEKDVLRASLWKVAGFCGVEVLAYCVMSNHFHVLVRVPKKMEGELTRAEVLRRYRILYEEVQFPGYPTGPVMEGILMSGEDEALAEEWMGKLTSRMQDVSEFIRMLKHRMTIFYNKTHKRFGTLWAERFKSVLVENTPAVLRTVAAYLDLNPVRAGLVEDPANYLWCSYAEAMQGEHRAQRGVCAVMGEQEWLPAMERYRIILFGKGGVVKRSGQAAIPAERVREVLESGGKLELHELLRCRVRHFTAGAVIGSKQFVREVGAALNGKAPGDVRLKQKLKSLGKLPLSEELDFKSLRKLVKTPISSSPFEAGLND